SNLVPVITLPEKTVISVKWGVAPDFSKPVTYIVTAEDGTTKEYTVIVKKAQNSEKLITVFAFRELNPVVSAEVSQEQENIELSVPYGTDRTKLVASFKISPEAVVKVEGEEQISGETKQDFTNPVRYIVTAQDGSLQNYIVTVTVAAAASETKLTSFSLNLSGTVTNAVIDEVNHKIYAEVPMRTVLKMLTPIFTFTGKSVYVGEVQQQSGITVNDFRRKVIYRVISSDDSYIDYEVTIKKSAGIR
ncbi:MAG: hypothetical protein PHC45_11120, partial [Clostridiaceae bacterium]|nr:hypothetical protein [Clostridiaceae bacterium]